MAQAKTGDTVRVHYTGTLGDGTVFDSSLKGDPLEFTLGEGRLIPGFERAVLGMAPGDVKTVTIPMQEAYGPRNEEMVLVVNRSELPDDLEPDIGQLLQVLQPDGRRFILTVTAVSESTVTLDGNHPLAGHDLTFTIQLLEIL